ncbi:unnamed protein product [Paramecium octaurelia]|uniref:Tetratricopeptide repeat protein n=1 Tax=Paramecium octaurelia TaxID=43137 RepID=A0A8S1YDM6_PAROT|nr:unnamed protein product [Paramecium octaurelia]
MDNNLDFQNNLNLKCQTHQYVQAKCFCLRYQCEQNRVACDNCFNVYHSSHSDQVKPIHDLTSYLQQKSQQAEKFLQNYFNQFNQLQQTFNRTIKALQYTFGNQSKDFLQMDQIQLISLLNQLLTFDSLGQFLNDYVVQKLEKMNEIQSQILQTLPLHLIVNKLPETLVENLANYKKYGLQLMNSNQFGQAITLFDKVLERIPYDVEVLLKKGECLFKQNLYYEAQKQYEEILYFKPQNIDAWCGIGNCLLKCNKYDEAIIRFQMCLKMNKNYYMALLGNADALRKKINLTEALEEYDKAIRVNQQGYSAFCGKAECLKSLNDLNRSEEMYRKALQIVDNHFDSLFGLADCLKRQKQYYEAIPYYSKSLEISPQHPESLEGKASCLKYCGHNSEAVQFYQLALQYDPSSADALKGLGASLYHLGQYDESIAAFEKALEFNSCSSVCYKGKADCFRRQGKWKEAVEYYLLAIKYDSTQLEAQHWISVLARLIKQIKPPQENLFINSQNLQLIFSTEYIEQLSFLLKAEIYHAIIPPKDAGTYPSNIIVGFMLLITGFYQDAKGYYNKALEIEEFGTDALWGRGECLRLQLKFTEALQYYEKALEICSFYDLKILQPGLEIASIEYIQALSIFGKTYCLIAQNKFQEAIEFLFNSQGFILKIKHIELGQMLTIFCLQFISIIVLKNLT